jgi:polyisoprenoid-binding protein YceI
MKSLVAITAQVTAWATLAVGAAHADNYKIDTVHSQVFFSVSHLGFSFSTGRFHVAEGAINFDGKDWTQASVQTTIKLDSLDLGDATWKEHVNGERFLSAAKFPTMTFKSTSVEKVSDTQLKVTGDLTLHGVTKPVVLDTRVNKVAQHPMLRQPAAGFSATTRIKRSDFGMGAMVPNIGDDIDIRIEIESSVPAPGK